MSEVCEKCGGPVVFAEDCELCPCCEERLACVRCGLHYDECECCGPHGCAKQEAKQ